MLIEHEGCTPEIDSLAYVAPNATICGNVSIGSGKSHYVWCMYRGRGCTDYCGLVNGSLRRCRLIFSPRSKARLLN
jgi:hypothetical protein